VQANTIGRDKTYMQDFRYKYGDRPLEGYTIQRAAGRGGFGEVYYALSDSGRQVALKTIQNYEQIELRGISQCMNLKNPHLVTIFDVKYNKQGRPFVIMEYVSGPSLRELLADSPGGLGAQKAAFFLQEIAKGLSFLHECGIVHRDLKPGNIFYENGYVKIGDYGLTKAINASRHSGQTITVGTVHYMAPEIGAGCYDRSIDIYALGVLLYEMLTGQVPFFGSSPAEILMKHMTAEPELEGVEEPFARVIRKALEKDPADRYQTVQEMVEDVFGSEHIRNSVSQFSAEDLSIVAERLARKAKTGVRPDERVSAETAADRVPPGLGQRIEQAGRRIDAARDKLVRKLAAAGVKGQAENGDAAGLSAEAVDRHQRRTLALITMTAVAVGAGVLSAPTGGGILPAAISVFVMVATCSKSILFLRWRWLAAMTGRPRWLRNIAVGAPTALVTTVVGAVVAAIVLQYPSRILMPYSEYAYGFGRTPHPVRVWLALTISLSLFDWWQLTSPARSRRVSLSHALLVGLAGFLTAALFGGSAITVFCVLAGASLVVQIMSPLGAASAERPAATSGVCMVPPWARMFWLLGFVILLGMGLMLLIWSGMARLGADEFAIAISFGIGGLLFSLFCLTRAFRQTYRSLYRYLIKPLLLLICLQFSLTAAVFVSNGHLGSDETLVALFFLIFPAILFFVVAFVPSRAIEHMVGQFPAEPAGAQRAGIVSPFKRIWALLLSGGMFLGINGLQRFYVGKIGTGILWLLTFGLFGIGQIVDVILILVGQFKDCNGARLVMWQSGDELRAAAVKETEVGAEVQNAAEAKNAQPHEEAIPQQAYKREAVQPLRTPTGYYQPFSPFGYLLSAIGYLFLLVALLIALAVALHLPMLVAAGAPDPHLARELQELFGYAGWPQLLERIGFMLASVLLLFAGVFIILGRRQAGAAHIIRSAVGLLGLLLALLFLSEVVPSYSYNDATTLDMLNQGQIGPALDRLIDSTDKVPAVFAAAVFAVSVIILAWPPRRIQSQWASAVARGRAAAVRNEGVN